MGVIIKDVKITEPKTIYFDLSKKVGNKLKYKIDSITKHNEFLAEHTKKTKLVDCCPNISMELIFTNTENIKNK